MPDDIEVHLVMCLTKPRLNYNGNGLAKNHYLRSTLFISNWFAEDVLTDEKGECVICLEDLLKGHVIARLPCLCVYHKRYFCLHLLLTLSIEYVMSLPFRLHCPFIDSLSCIDQWFDVNRSCPEHPSDWTTSRLWVFKTFISIFLTTKNPPV